MSLININQISKQNHNKETISNTLNGTQENSDGVYWGRKGQVCDSQEEETRPSQESYAALRVDRCQDRAQGVPGRGLVIGRVLQSRRSTIQRAYEELQRCHWICSILPKAPGLCRADRR